MLISVRGRVEADPMRVPLPASVNAGRADAFADVLQERLVAERDAAPKAVEAPRREEPAAPETTAPVAADADVERDDVAEQLPQQAEAVLHDDHGEGTAAAAPFQETTRRGETVRQETAGKGADSPRPSSATGEQLLAFAINPPADKTLTTAVVIPGNSVSGVTGAKAAAQPLTRGAGLDQALPQTPARSGAVTAGYRTNTAASAQLLEQARDSVFKQILLKLNDGGGEMRMRLQPPDLGELDLRLSVEGGNRLHLAISAERPDMTALLQRHLDELTRSLQSAGLDVAGAHVQTRDGDARRALHDAEFGGSDDDHLDEANAAPGPRMGGWVSAEGLDYWA